MATVPSAFDDYQKLLQEQFKQSQTLADERAAVRQQQRDMINQPTNSRLLNPGQKGLLDVFRDGPDAAQNKFITDFGLMLMASDPNKALSQRIGSALGSGVAGMGKERDKERARNLSLSKIDMEDIQAKTELLKERQANRKSLFDLSQAQEASDRAKEGLGIRQEGLKIQQEAANRSSDEYTRKQNLDFLTPSEFAKNKNTSAARKAVDPYIEAGFTIQELKDYTIARRTKDISTLPPEMKRMAEMQAQINGTSVTELNPDYNQFLVQALKDAGNPLLSGTGIEDTDVDKYKTYSTGSKSISDEQLVKKLPNYNELKTEFGRLYPKRPQTDENIAEYARQVAERNAKNRKK